MSACPPAGADFEIPLSLPAAPPKYAGDSYPRPAGMVALTARLDAADAFVLVTPEYNQSYPAPLKAAIDWHFTQRAAKPVAFVSYGGAAGGRHGGLHLANVLTELTRYAAHAPASPRSPCTTSSRATS